MTWVAIAALLGVDGFMQDQSDSSVSLLGEHMDKINTKMAGDAATIAAHKDQSDAIATLTSRAETAEAALVEAGRQHDLTKASLATATADLATRTQELTAANAKLAQRPPAGAIVPPTGGAQKDSANDMAFQKELYARLNEFGTPPPPAKKA